MWPIELEQCYHCSNTYQGQQESVQDLQGNQLANISIPGKVFAKVLNNQVRRVTEKKIMEEQAEWYRMSRADFCDEALIVHILIIMPM